MKTRSLLVASAAGLLSLGAVVPAFADAAGTTASLTITGGTLQITAPAAAGSLGSIANSPSGGLVSGALGQVQVNDARAAGVGLGWVVTVISTALTPIPAGATIPASAIGYTVGTVTKVGTAVMAPADAATLVGQMPVLVATATTGAHSATWTPTINVNVPGNMAPAVYSGLVTHTVA